MAKAERAWTRTRWSGTRSKVPLRMRRSASTARALRLWRERFAGYRRHAPMKKATRRWPIGWSPWLRSTSNSTRRKGRSGAGWSASSGLLAKAAARRHGANIARGATVVVTTIFARIARHLRHSSVQQLCKHISPTDFSK